jgi:hypothetical protein
MKKEDQKKDETDQGNFDTVVYDIELGRLVFPPEGDDFDMEAMLDSFTWTSAKTMPEIPHEYIVIPKHPEKQREIDIFMTAYKLENITDWFEDKEYQYLTIGNHKYWVIDNIINREEI